MKFLMCAACRDVVALSRVERECMCGAVGGKYREDGGHADYHGDALIFGVDSRHLIGALALRGTEIEQFAPLSAFVIPETAPRVHRR